MGAYYFYPATGGYGSSGVPDIVCCLNGRFIGIECKAGKGKTTALQDKNLHEIREAGGTALVVNEENVDQLTKILES
jgi:Holliday junction resolvase